MSHIQLWTKKTAHLWNFFWFGHKFVSFWDSVENVVPWTFSRYILLRYWSDYQNSTLFSQTILIHFDSSINIFTKKKILKYVWLCFCLHFISNDQNTYITKRILKVLFGKNINFCLKNRSTLVLFGFDNTKKQNIPRKNSWC